MSDDSPRDTLLAWLQEAHAMAQHGQTMLEGRAKDLDAYPQLQARISAHAAQTKDQARRIEDCIERLNSNTSRLKDIGGKVSAVGHSWATRMSGEQPVQAHAASYAFEHFEIGNYRALIAAADLAGESAVKQICEEILAEQQTMADWLGAHLDETTRQFLG